MVIAFIMLVSTNVGAVEETETDYVFARLMALVKELSISSEKNLSLIAKRWALEQGGVVFTEHFMYSTCVLVSLKIKNDVVEMTIIPHRDDQIYKRAKSVQGREATFGDLETTSSVTNDDANYPVVECIWKGSLAAYMQHCVDAEAKMAV